jgi:BlaI family transcriptional regulator, penicillinase repressor
MKNNSKPTESELEILQVLWELGASTVRTVNDELCKRKGTEVGYTTTLKQIQIMYEKGFVSRNDDAKTHIFKAAIAETETKKQLLDRFVDNVFRGSAMNLVMQALGGKKSNADEISEIRRFLDEMENKENKNKSNNTANEKGGDQ